MANLNRILSVIVGLWVALGTPLSAHAKQPSNPAIESAVYAALQSEQLNTAKEIFDNFDIDPKRFFYTAQNKETHQYLASLGANVGHPANLVRYGLRFGRYSGSHYYNPGGHNSSGRIETGGGICFNNYGQYYNKTYDLVLQYLQDNATKASSGFYGTRLTEGDIQSIEGEFGKIDGLVVGMKVGVAFVRAVMSTSMPPKGVCTFDSFRELITQFLETQAGIQLMRDPDVASTVYSIKPNVEQMVRLSKAANQEGIVLGPMTAAPAPSPTPSNPVSVTPVTPPASPRDVFEAAITAPRSSTAVQPFASEELRKTCDLYRAALMNIYAEEPVAAFNEKFRSFDAQALQKARQNLEAHLSELTSSDGKVAEILKLATNAWTPKLVRKAAPGDLSNLLSQFGENKDYQVEVFSVAELEEYLQDKRQSLELKLVFGEHERVTVTFSRNAGPRVRSTSGPQSVIWEKGKISYYPVLPTMPSFSQWVQASMKLNPEEFAPFTECAKSWGPPVVAIADEVGTKSQDSVSTVKTATAAAAVKAEE